MGSLNVHITYSSGKGKKGVRVVGETSGFIGGLTKAVKTDSEGHALISWKSSTSTLSAIYVDGKKHKGKYKSGSSYAFSG